MIDFVYNIDVYFQRKEVINVFTNKLVSNFKDRLAILCIEKRLPDSDIAKDLGISKQTLSAWKCGTRSPKGPTIETVARYFGVSIEWLMGFDVARMDEEEKPIPEDELDNELINLLSDLTPQETVRVIDFVAGLKAARAGEVSPHK